MVSDTAPSRRVRSASRRVILSKVRTAKLLQTWRRSSVNSTARWPERLEQTATLLRAEGAAILATSQGRYRTLFAYRIDPTTDWGALLGVDVVERALDAEFVIAPLPAGRWGDEAGFALVARLPTPEGPALLCALRRRLPFDAVDAASATAAAELLSLGVIDGRGVAERSTFAAPAPQASAERAARPEGERRLRVLAIEDHPVMRLGIRSLLEREGLAVAGITATCSEGLGLLRESAPDVVLVDLRLSDATGTQAIERIRAVAPALPIVALSVERSPALVRAAMRAGANGYLAKDAPSGLVVAALRAAAAGLSALGQSEALALARGDDEPEETGEEVAENGGTAATGAARDPLTPRELELLRYLAEGYTNKEIAKAMVLAEDTVKKGVQTLIAKLGATDRTHAVVLALRNRLID